MERRFTPRRAALVLLAGLSVTSGGCLVVAAGAAGGAAVGYAYYKAKVCETYQAQLGDAYAATKAALAELGMPVVAEGHDAGGGFIESRTGTGERVHVDLELLPSKIPAEGGQTRIGVRVANFGDRPVSERLLYQVGLRLTPANLAAVRPVPPRPPAQPNAIQPVSHSATQPLPPGLPSETPPPPLASPLPR